MFLSVVYVLGLAYREFVINEPPLPANCTVSPYNGTALVTKHDVECPDPFQDDDGIGYYEVDTSSDIWSGDPASMRWSYFHKGQHL